MKISSIPRNPSYFDLYINQVDDLALSDAFRQSVAVLDALDLENLHALGDRVYAPGKWTIRDMFQHLCDCERVFSYRALRFARNDKTALPGFDESVLAEHSGANRRPLEAILTELRCVREGAIQLFDSFDEEALRRTGIMASVDLPVLSIGFILVGHQNHHIRIMEERYLPMLQTN